MSQGKTFLTLAGPTLHSVLMLLSCSYAPLATSAPGTLPTAEELRQEERAQRSFALQHYLADLRRTERIGFNLLKSAAPYCHDAQAETIGVPPITAEKLPPDLRQSYDEGNTSNTRLPRFHHIAGGSPIAQAGIEEGDLLVSISIQDRVAKEHPNFSWGLERSIQSLTLQNTNPVFISTQRYASVTRKLINPVVICKLSPNLVRDATPTAQVRDGQLVISTGLLRELPTDTELAMIMAHQIATWLTPQSAAPAARLKNADYIAPFLLHGAGYSVANAKSAWLKLALGLNSKNPKSISAIYPYSAQRALAYKAVEDEILALQIAGKRIMPRREYLSAPISSRLVPTTPPSPPLETTPSQTKESIDPRLHDLSVVPLVDEQGLARYQRFLDSPLRPRAFAIGLNADTARWRSVSRFGPNAAADAINACQIQLPGGTCHLYALDDRVVWSPGNPESRLANNTPINSRVSAVPRKSPSDTGYAKISDVAAVPINASERASYMSFLEKPPSRAFLVMADGSSRYWLGDAALESALEFCEQSVQPCWLYAVDESIVWHVDESKRISRRNQLPTGPAEQVFF